MEEPEVDVAENDPIDDLGQALHNFAWVIPYNFFYSVIELFKP